MTSAMMTIADHMATDFREAVMEAEKADREAIEKITQEFNLAWTEFNNRDAVLRGKAEQAVRTLTEIADLHDVNHTTYERRLTALREQWAALKETKTPAMDPLQQAAMQYNPNLHNIVKMSDPQAQASRADAAKLTSKP